MTNVQSWALINVHKGTSRYSAVQWRTPIYKFKFQRFSINFHHFLFDCTTNVQTLALNNVCLDTFSTNVYPDVHHSTLILISAQLWTFVIPANLTNKTSLTILSALAFHTWVHNHPRNSGFHSASVSVIATRSQDHLLYRALNVILISNQAEFRIQDFIFGDRNHAEFGMQDLIFGNRNHAEFDIQDFIFGNRNQKYECRCL
jgi:hypothetical protein